jgi:hypothetical protein
MKKGTIITAVVLIFLGVFTLIGVTKYFSTQNTEIDLRTTTVAQNKKCEAYFDKMWKILKQKAGVTDQYKQAFSEIYPKLIEGRYSSGDGSLMKWITESNPEFDASMYKDLMKSIEIERTGYFNEQATLIDMQREHEAFIKKVPNRWFLGSEIKPIEIKIVTSASTKDAYATGEENDVELFEKQADKK